MRKFPAYEDGLTVLLGLTGALIFFDSNAVNFLSPFIVRDLHLNNAQLGLAAASASLTSAVAAFAVGRASDTTGRRKPFLVAGMVLFSLCSAASGLAGGFVGLLAARLLMGLGGGAPPLSNALMIEASSPSRRGLNIGMNSLFGVVLGFALAPLILVGLASHFGWRATFFVAGAPALLAALAIQAYVREAGPPAADARAPRASIGAASSASGLLQVRNVWLCALVGSLMVAGGSVSGTFLPLYLVKVRHLSVAEMSLVMGVSGGGMLSVPIVFALSDRLGRKPLLVTCAAAFAIFSVGLLYWTGGTLGLAVICFIASAGAGAGGLSIAVVPGESVGIRDRGAALGIVLGASQIVGGFGAPALAGLVADRVGLATPLMIAGGCGFSAMLLSLGVRETAPRHVQVLAGLRRPTLVPSE